MNTVYTIMGRLLCWTWPSRQLLTISRKKAITYLKKLDVQIAAFKSKCKKCVHFKNWITETNVTFWYSKSLWCTCTSSYDST